MTNTDITGDTLPVASPPATTAPLAEWHASTGFPLVCTPTGLALPDDITFDEWASISPLIHGAARSSQWWLGDWIRHGEAAYGAKYHTAAERTGLDRQTLRTAAMVAEAFPDVLRRRNTLSWSHHREIMVSVEDPAAWDDWLDKAEAGGWTRDDLRAQIRASKAVDVKATDTTDDEAEPSAKAEPTVRVSVSVPESAVDAEHVASLRRLLTLWRNQVDPSMMAALSAYVDSLEATVGKAGKRAA